MFRVLAKRCDQCLFSNARIVSEEGAQGIIAECLATDSHFICHKTQDVCCRGFYDTHKLDVWPIRLARMWGLVDFVLGHQRKEVTEE